MKLNEKIYQCRKKIGMSQVDLADALGVSRQSVSKWETGESNPEVSKIPQLAKLFGVTADWLLSEEDAPAAPTHAVSSKAWPDWVDQLPTSLGNLIKRFGWLFGVRMAIGGGLIAAIGLVARLMFSRMLGGFGSMGGFGAMSSFEDLGGEILLEHPMVDFPGVADSFTTFQSGASDISAIFTGFMIFLGLAIMVAGIVLALLLKKWGEDNQ